MTSMEMDGDSRTPGEELEWRHVRLSNLLEPLELDMTAISTNPNLYYVAGSIQEGMVLLCPELPEPVYLVKRVLERAQHESALSDIRPSVSPRKLREVLGLGNIKRVGMELDTIPHGWAERVRSGLGGSEVELVDISGVLRQTRAVKSAWEVDRITEAAAQVDGAMERATHVLSEGMTELELAAELEREMRMMGHEGLVRMHRFGSEMHVGGVLSGPSAALPTWHQAVMGGGGLSPALPHGASRRRIARGEPVAVDLCGISHGYLVDETRTFVVGSLTEEAADALRATQAILRAMEAILVPGASNEGLWDRAEELARSLGVIDGFMGIGSTKMRFIGHGVGLELDELPVLAHRMPGELPEGAVVALEPKVVLPGLGVLGEENTYYVKSDGPRVITRAPPGPIIVD
jgi:Xaa-Pro aminopeptidase